MALVLPTVTLTLATRAEAQVTQLPSWAVTEFKDLKGGTAKYGQVAADAIAGELAKTNKYDVVAQDTVKRSLETLGLTSPLEGFVNLSRVGQDIRATVIVQGEIVDYQVRPVGGGKQALVVMRTVAYNVASGLPVNGAYEKGESTIRGGNVTNEALINDAIAQAAAGAVIRMQSQQLPTATVLNTGLRTALINQGARSGFKTGDVVILTRGPLQVGTARVGSVEPDQAEITIERTDLGVAPGDKVNAVFTVPALPPIGISAFNANGSARGGSSRPRGRSNNATLISALLVVGLVAVLLSSGNSSGTNATARTRAEASLDTDGNTPTVRITWSANGFFKGSGSTGNGVARWQIYRNDVSLNPVIVTDGAARSADDSSARNTSIDGNYARFNRIGGTTCDFAAPTNATFVTTTVPTVVPGRPYVYQIEAVYSVLGIDLPNGTTGGTGNTGGTGGTGGITAGGTTGGITAGGTGGTGGTGGITAGGTGGTAGGTGGVTAGGTGGTTAGGTAGNTGGATGGSQLCYFQSGRSTTGRATPLSKPVVTAPTGTIPTPIQNFTFTGSANVNASINAVYVIEFSDSRDFLKGSTVRTKQFITTTFRVDTLDSGIFNSRLRNASPVFYRIGVRNADDRPGPVPNGASKQRYIYSNPAQFTRPLTNPGPP